MRKTHITLNKIQSPPSFQSKSPTKWKTQMAANKSCQISYSNFYYMFSFLDGWSRKYILLITEIDYFRNLLPPAIGTKIVGTKFFLAILRSPTKPKNAAETRKSICGTGLVYGDRQTRRFCSEFHRRCAFHVCPESKARRKNSPATTTKSVRHAFRELRPTTEPRHNIVFIMFMGESGWVRVLCIRLLCTWRSCNDVYFLLWPFFVVVRWSIWICINMGTRCTERAVCGWLAPAPFLFGCTGPSSANGH